MNENTEPPQADFETGTFPVQVLAVFRAPDWRPTTVLYRINQAAPQRHPTWSQPLGITEPNPQAEWRYLSERVREGRGGNWYTYELIGFEVGSVDDITAVLPEAFKESITTVEAVPKPVDAPLSQPDPPPPTLLITRVDAPSWVTTGSSQIGDASFNATGEQAEWGVGIPMVYRALASPLTYEPVLAAPQRGDDGVPAGTAYWSALLNLLIYSFGWARPDRGILWWQWAGRPTDDLRFQLLSQVWADDGMLDWFLCWLYTAPRQTVLPMLEELTGYRDNDDDAPRNPGWVEDQVAEADESGIPAPCSHLGGDPLHLASHATGPLQQPRGKVTLLRSPTEERRATLIVESMVGWYRALVEAGSTLPTLKDQSWHIAVYARPVGYLGTYRRSRVSGIWFSGPHRYHEPGFDESVIGRALPSDDKRG